MIQSTLPFTRFGRAAVLALALLVPALGLLFLPREAPPVKQAEKPKDNSSATLEIRKGDHISILGNTLADRMQHDGWLETMLQSRFPEHQLSVRNLGFSGDELTLRLRSANFGSPEEWLTRTSTDVVFAFFGYNESFGGEAGLPKFKKDLEDFIKKTTGQSFNGGKSKARLVLFSPIAHENLKDPNLPDGTENNNRLALYTAAMAEVASANKVPFVELFGPTRVLYAKAKAPLTINGIHLTAEGNRQLAEVIDKALFADTPEPKRDEKLLAKLRAAINEKDFYWFNRYRTTDGFSIYGGRADLKFVGGQTNRVVAQREMEVLDVMTANRDKVVVAAAQGKEIKADDKNIPEFIPVVTNKPGKGPNGKHLFLDGTEAIDSMTIDKRMKVNLFASEKEFKDLVNPVQMSWDTKGRLWVAVWPTYPHWKPTEEMNDKLLILEDTDGDGKADKCTPFAENLHNPTGFEFYNGGVLIAQAPDLIFLKDTDGDGKADVRTRVIHGLDSADTHHTSNSFVLDPFGGLYFQEGTFHHTQVESPYGPPQRCANGGVFRYEPRTQKFEVYVTTGFANPHGHVFDRWGQDIVVDGTGANPYHAPLFSGYMEYPQKHPKPPQVYQQRTRPCPGMEYMYSSHFPAEMQGNLIVPNVIGFQGLLRYKIEAKGSTLSGTELEPILSSTDPNFRPSDVKVGPDGAIYFLDWHNPIIGHMQHNLRDPSRDREHGRVYRVTMKDRELVKPIKIDGEPLDKVLDVLKSKEERNVYRARIELSGRKTEDVLAALKTWLAKLDPKDADYEHQMLQALWLQQMHNSVDVALLKSVLTARSFETRAAATRVLCYARAKVPEALELLKKQAADEHPRVRMEAVRAASFFKAPEALEVTLISAEYPSDAALEFCRAETLKTLEPIWKKALAEGKSINFTSDVGARYFLKGVNTDDLLKMKRSKAVFLEMLFRKGIQDNARREALTGLAKLDNKKEMKVLLDTIKAQDDQKTGTTDESVAFDLVRLMTSREAGELKEVRNEIEELATGGKQPLTRQLALVALIAADNDVEKAWALATKSVPALRDLLAAMPLIRDVNAKTALYPKVLPLLDGLPKHLTTGTGGGKATAGRYVRVELPGKGTLTLAEVEVYSDGKNVARKGKATQKSTASGGDASRAIDGNTSGRYNDGGQTHTQEGINNPWWEVDLGSEVPIETIVIFNRTDEGLGKRLDGFTLRVLDARKNVVLEKTRQPAPDAKVKFDVGSDAPEVTVRRAAMFALTSVRGQELSTFQQLARFIKGDADRATAVEAMLKLKAEHWPKEEAKPLVEVLLGYVRKLPVSERTTPAAVAALELAEGLAGLLPADQAKAIRKEIGDVGVRVLRIGTVHDSMLFDKERLIVQAGKPIEFLFQNTDIMPHNLVVIEPGSLEEIGNAAELAATQPGALERHYVPVSKKVLLASRLLQPRDSQQLAFTAPKKAGVYPYVCTYPGHWRRMHGALYVVDDLEQYQADPEGYLAKHPLPIVDELLKFNRPRKEWTIAELSPLVEKMKGGRNFSTGRQMFTIANCVACHKFGGVGVEMGPDLTKYDPKWTSLDIMKEMVEPSARINEKYYTYVFTLKSGKSVTGLIVEETPTAYKVVENPLLKTAVVEIKKSDVDDKVKSPTSQMPKGLLDKLTPEEILDLIAYVTAKGDAKHKLFEGGGHEHHH